MRRQNNSSNMIQGYGPVTQALLGTLLTWGLTALGSGMVVFLRGNQVIMSRVVRRHNCSDLKKKQSLSHSANRSTLHSASLPAS